MFQGGIYGRGLERRCRNCRKHEVDGTEPKHEEDGTELPRASAAPSTNKRDLPYNLEMDGTKKEQKKNSVIAFDAEVFKILNALGRLRGSKIQPFGVPKGQKSTLWVTRRGYIRLPPTVYITAPTKRSWRLGPLG